MVAPERLAEGYNPEVYRNMHYRPGEELTVVGWSVPMDVGQIYYLVGEGDTAYAEDCLEPVGVGQTERSGR